MSKPLPSRPNLEHLRGQAKELLALVRAGDPGAARLLAEHLPAARAMTPAQVQEAGFRLADAQSAIARRSGFGSWPSLGRHVDQLRGLEGTWEFTRLEVDGHAMPVAALGNSRLLLDGDRFRMESPEASYEGIFDIDVERDPHHIDIEFVAGPEAGNWSYGLFELAGDELRICLGLTGVSRPERFTSAPGSGHALESLRRSSRARPEHVDGGEPPTPAPTVATGPMPDFDGPISPVLLRLEGQWRPLEVVLDGKPLPRMMLPMGHRTTTGNEVKVVFGGQVMVHAKVRIDETRTPIEVDYLNLNGASRGLVSLGIMDWQGDVARFCMASPGSPRPAEFASEPGSGRTLSRWRKG